MWKLGRRTDSPPGATGPLVRQDTLTYAPFMGAEGDIGQGKVSDRYRNWFFAAKKHGLAEVEQLVPYYEVPFAPPAAERHANARGDDAAAQALLRRFPPQGWGYHMALSPNYGTMGKLADLTGPRALSRRRADYRLNFIMTGLEAYMGRSLAGLSLLDIACNWGGFAVEARLRGATGVHGFDIRPENVAKARALAEFHGVDDIGFSQADLYDFAPEQPFDVVLNLGLMYHITQPVEMMKKTFALTRDIAVFDTVVHREAFAGFILGTGEGATTHAATAVGMELHPTYRGLLELARMVGFVDVVELHGLPDAGWNGFADEPYGNKTRRCIVCRKPPAT